MALKTWINLFRAAMQREEGQTMAEYGVVLAPITLAVPAALCSSAAPSPESSAPSPAS